MYHYGEFGGMAFRLPGNRMAGPTSDRDPEAHVDVEELLDALRRVPSRPPLPLPGDDGGSKPPRLVATSLSAACAALEASCAG